MSDWFVYDASGTHRGPFSAESLVREIRVGNLSMDDTWITEDVWFGAPGDLGWKKPADIPELAALLQAELNPLRVVDGAYKSTARGTPEFGATVMMIGNVKPSK